MKKGKIPPYLAGHIWGNTGLFLCVATALFLMVTAYEAQAAKEAAKIGESETGFKAGSIILAPIPIQDPSIGTGLVAVGAYLFKTAWIENNIRQLSNITNTYITIGQRF